MEKFKKRYVKVSLGVAEVYPQDKKTSISLFSKELTEAINTGKLEKYLEVHQISEEEYDEFQDHD